MLRRCNDNPQKWRHKFSDVTLPSGLLIGRSCARCSRTDLWLPTFHGIDTDGRGYIHEVCAFCFGEGRQCCDGRGYILGYVDAQTTAEIVAEHDRRGTVAVIPDLPPDWLEHAGVAHAGSTTAQ